MEITYPLQDAHALSQEEILLTLQSNDALGLSNAEAEKRTASFGLNQYETKKQKSLACMFLLQFHSMLVYLLIFAAALTFYFQNYIESYAILAVILLNAFIGFFMELQARSSMNALKSMDIILARVLRNGTTQEIPSENLVPGDVLILQAGDVISADARLIEAHQLQCDESSLTGESLPSEKNVEVLPKETVLGDRLNCVFKGNSVTNGTGKAVVYGIAKETQLGAITSMVESAKEQKTPLDLKIAVLGKRLIWITLGMTLVFAITGFIQGKHWLLILETSIALAVAAFPEGLPIVATVALAHGMLVMARRNVIVKKLAAVETLGSTNAILTDKTGTLTENTIFTDTLWFHEEISKVSIKNKALLFENGAQAPNDSAFQKLRLIAALCNDATKAKENAKTELLGDPIEIALVHFTNASGNQQHEILAEYPRIAEVPFNSEAKIMGTLHTHSNGQFTAAKGSVEHLLEKCISLQKGSEMSPLDETEKAKIILDSEKMAADGLRVLGFAYNEEAQQNAENMLNELVFVAMIGFLDPPRTDVKDAIVSCRTAGIKVVMITGDHPLTALNIAKKVGLVDDNEQNTVIGNDLPSGERISDDWRQKILSTAVFARTTPKQKLDIVSVYQEDGNIVAMTGDGVNDAPALKKADIGIAMGLRGTQVAKETASIVLKDDSFASIAEAVWQGRIIFNNIQKFVIYLVSCNLSEIFIVTALGFFVPASTLLPLQILLLNMVTDVFPALALGLGKGDKSFIQKLSASKDTEREIVSKKDWRTIFFYAFTMTMSVVVAVLFCQRFFTDDAKILNNVAFLTLAFAQLFHVFNMAEKGTHMFLNEITKNKFVWLALVLCSAVMLLVFVIPQARLVLGLELFALNIWLLSLAASLIPLLVVQILRRMRRN